VKERKRELDGEREREVKGKKKERKREIMLGRWRHRQSEHHPKRSVTSVYRIMSHSCILVIRVIEGIH
jgi:hypothetical protein